MNHKPLTYVRPGVAHAPWGASDCLDTLGESGAVKVSTPSHGGIWIPENLFRLLPLGLRQTAYSQGGWFEEDCDVCIPIAYFGEQMKSKPEYIRYARSYILGEYSAVISPALKQTWEAEQAVSA